MNRNSWISFSLFKSSLNDDVHSIERDLHRKRNLHEVNIEVDRTFFYNPVKQPATSKRSTLLEKLFFF